VPTRPICQQQCTCTTIRFSSVNESRLARMNMSCHICVTAFALRVLVLPLISCLAFVTRLQRVLTRACDLSRLCVSASALERRHVSRPYNCAYALQSDSRKSCDFVTSCTFLYQSLLELWGPETDTGWRRCIGCLKLQVSFRKQTTNYRALLRKETYKDKAPYGSSPPYTLAVDVLILQELSF